MPARSWPTPSASRGCSVAASASGTCSSAASDRGSLDSSIVADSEVPNDIPGSAATASDDSRDRVERRQGAAIVPAAHRAAARCRRCARASRLLDLPSTSPANASIPRARQVRALERAAQNGPNAHERGPGFAPAIAGVNVSHARFASAAPHSLGGTGAWLRHEECETACSGYRFGARRAQCCAPGWRLLVCTHARRAARRC